MTLSVPAEGFGFRSHVDCGFGGAAAKVIRNAVEVGSREHPPWPAGQPRLFRLSREPYGGHPTRVLRSGRRLQPDTTTDEAGVTVDALDDARGGKHIARLSIPRYSLGRPTEAIHWVEDPRVALLHDDGPVLISLRDAG